MSSCRTSRAAPAPMAARTAISRAGRGAGEQEVRDVGAGDEQHEADGANEDPQRRRTSPTTCSRSGTTPNVSCPLAG